MKYVIGVFLLLTISIVTVHGQQRPQYTQYIFNNYLVNPAISGIENYTDIKIGYRQQWTGIRDAPRTSFISAHWKLGDDYLWRNALSLPGNDDDPMSRNNMQNYTSSPSHHGMGVIAVLDEVGPISRLYANLTYAYHLQMNDQLNLSVGIAAGISRIGLDVNALEFQTGYDQVIQNAYVSQIRPDLNLGIWLYGSRFFAGASVQQVLPQQLKFSSESLYNSGKDVPHYFFTAGYRLFLDEEITAIPSVMLRKVSPTPVAIDANLKIAFKDRVWIGGSYRRNDSFSALAGINVSKLLNLTYSYDFITSDLSKVSNGTHEIVLGIQLNNIYEVMSKAKMW